MHTIRPDQASDEQAVKVLACLGRDDGAVDITPRSTLAALFARPEQRFVVAVRSASRPGIRYDIRVTWHPGYVEAGHYGHACPAADASRRCWHLYAAVARVADYYGGKIPVAATPLRAAPRPQPTPRRRATAADAGFYG